MRSLKDTNIFKEVVSLIDESSCSGSILYNLFNNLDLGKLPGNTQIVYPRDGIIKLFILFKLLSVSSIYSAVQSEWNLLLPLGKDVLYKIKNSSWMPWRTMLYRQAKQCLPQDMGQHADVYSPWTLPCFIVDDSDLIKRGKCIEWIGRIYSHVTGRYDFGFKSLNLALWTGKNLIHLDFSFHVEMGKKGNQGLTPKQARQRFGKAREDHHPASKRVREAFGKKSDQLIAMLGRSITRGITAHYLLADSWFFCEKLVAFVLKNDLHLISRPKFNNWLYEYQNRSYTLGNLIKKLRRSKKSKWSRNLKMHHITVALLYKGHKVRIFFYKEKKRGSKWNALISTDKSIGAIQAYKVYKNRWSIEVSYKELKQHLGYGKCQSRDFDAHIADGTHSLMAYNYLSCIKAANEYQSIGYLFKEVSENWIKPTVMERFWNMFYKAIQAIAELVQISVDELLNAATIDEKFFSKWRKSILLIGAET